MNIEDSNQPLTYDDIKIPENLNNEQQTELIELLNVYRSCFALSITELGCTHLGEMDIIIKTGTQPYAAKPYRVSRDERDEIQRHVQT